MENIDRILKKNKTYETINVIITRDELKQFISNNLTLLKSLKRPSIDRVDSKLDYILSNIRLMELSDNIQRKKPSNGYLNGNFKNKLRGVRKNKKSYSVKMTISGLETYLGSYENKEDAYKCFYTTYLEFYGCEPFCFDLVTGVK